MPPCAPKSACCSLRLVAGRRILVASRRSEPPVALPDSRLGIVPGQSAGPPGALASQQRRTISLHAHAAIALCIRPAVRNVILSKPDLSTRSLDAPALLGPRSPPPRCHFQARQQNHWTAFPLGARTSSRPLIAAAARQRTSHRARRLGAGRARLPGFRPRRQAFDLAAAGPFAIANSLPSSSASSCLARTRIPDEPRMTAQARPACQRTRGCPAAIHRFRLPKPQRNTPSGSPSRVTAIVRCRPFVLLVVWLRPRPAHPGRVASRTVLSVRACARSNRSEPLGGCSISR